MPPKNKQRKEWEVTINDWQSKQYYCAACRDTGVCHKCGGAGCMDCSYVGICQHCCDEKGAYVEGLA